MPSGHPLVRVRRQLLSRPMYELGWEHPKEVSCRNEITLGSLSPSPGERQLPTPEWKWASGPLRTAEWGNRYISRDQVLRRVKAVLFVCDFRLGTLRSVKCSLVPQPVCRETDNIYCSNALWEGTLVAPSSGFLSVPCPLLHSLLMERPLCSDISFEV